MKRPHRILGLGFLILVASLAGYLYFSDSDQKAYKKFEYEARTRYSGVEEEVLADFPFVNSTGTNASEAGIALGIFLIIWGYIATNNSDER